MTDKGYIKLFREILDKGYYKKSQYIHLWVHLLLKANYKKTKITYCEKEMIVLRGQFVTGRKKLSEETGICESTVENVLKLLENEHQIKQQKFNLFRLITIINYKKYQDSDSKFDNKMTTKKQQNDNKVTQVKKEKKKKERDTKVSLKKETAESIPLSVFPKAKLRITAQDEQDFEQFWKWYPRKINKVAAKKSYLKNAPDEKTRQQVLDAVMYQVSSGKFNLDDNMRFCPHATTWLNQKRFEDEIPPEAFQNDEEK